MVPIRIRPERGRIVTEDPIRLIVPEVGEDELREIATVFASGYLTQGPKVEQFERAIADRLGVRHAVATTSATTALHLTLVALGIGPGDDVLLPDFTFPATANVVVQAGARPVLVDIDAATYCIDTGDLAAKVTPRSRAVIPVHAFGLSADMDPVNAVAAEHGLTVVEDAACAIGSTYRGRPCGTLANAGCFSFHPRKAITTGEGGMVTTDDDVLAGKLRLLRSHGGLRSEGRFTFEAAGFNYRLSDVLAAMGVAQIRKLDRIIEEKRRLASLYGELLAGIDQVTCPVTPPSFGHVFQSYVVMLDDVVDRDKVIASMKSQGIETTLGTYSLHREPYFSGLLGHPEGAFPVALRTYRQSLTLPLYPGLQEGQVARVADALEKATSTNFI